MLKREWEILYFFAKEPWRKYNFAELQRVTGKKSRSYLFSVLKDLVSAGVLKQELAGHIPFYSLNTGSAKSRNFSGFVLEYSGWKRRNIDYGDLQNIMDRIPVHDYVFIITGSYARENQTRESDMDAVILIDDSAEPKRVYAELSFYCKKNIPPIHLYVFRNGEFIEMLRNKEANYGKEIAKNSMVLAGGQIYVKLIWEAIQNGFDGKSLY
jgi:DNA-binding HxlR family transcriptional regulator